MAKKITKLCQTCPACPSQWEADLEDGQFAYIRYRWGVLSWGIGGTIDAAVYDSRDHAEIRGDGLDGEMSTEVMLEHLRNEFDVAGINAAVGE
jgi:hypothetical protein